jgi:Iap family predicted aminopeptidase
MVKVKDNALYNPFEPQDANNNASFIPLGDFGDISYGTGLVTIPSLTINSLIPEDSEYLYFYVDVVENDIRPDFNQILTILDSDISVTVKTEAEIAIDDPK